MSLLDDIEEGRAVAESRMLDTCEVTRKGPKTWNEEAGEWTYPTVSVYTGICRVKQLVNESREVEAGSQLISVSGLEIHLPVGAEGVEAGDRVLVTASATRSEQAGRVFKIVAQFDGTQTTALRFRVEASDER